MFALRASVLALLAAVAVLAACSKVTQENYEHIDTGMARADVVKLLGEPDKADSGSALGISGETAIWEHAGTVITLRLVNGMVIAKDLQTR
ncbi:hypothetical protein [Amantichitinum ursilacus]|uniref:Lipoprotein SmpA/OmlA domain-containing protein n=1 Tax=Amantichitinum ursilacus TaxID=857265 RepID=A0A0N0XKZ6_9NEIS|nr:hypothetical protein [Amantichitinum ursilacus]KPC52856.1 hypothetical protein WG78_10215 [Amantichitinum ursilacus]